MKTDLYSNHAVIEIESKIVNDEILEMPDGSQYRIIDREYDSKPLKDAIKALKMLGKEVKRIRFFGSVYMTLDKDINPEYSKYPDEILDRMYADFTRLNAEIHIDSKGRLYTHVDKYKIYLPSDTCDSCSNFEKLTYYLEF